ncbi:hypothetical protein [Brevibacillus thermoruber]|uniref:hypothetical protein n=1 Tax=Brevibacillus thermoruber TaxID=33942 RepID=UPI00055222DE|nr:hypothetical protein [Brevibacillus thermoruber]
MNKFLWLTVVWAAAVHVLLSVPVMLGWGVVIDFVPGASLTDKVAAYVIAGLESGFWWKIAVSGIIGLILAVRHQKKGARTL